MRNFNSMCYMLPETYGKVQSLGRGRNFLFVLGKKERKTFGGGVV